MKILDRIALVIFSLIILILAITSCLVVFDVVELEKIYEYLEGIIKNDIVSKTILIISVISILLAIKALFFSSKIKKKEEIKSGILLENRDGRLLISRDTIENLVNGVVKSFPDAMDVQTKILLDIDNNITVFISLLVKQDSIIKELSSNIQTKIKETIKRNTDLEVSQININIKNIENINDNSKKEIVKAEKSVEKIKIENIQINDSKEEVQRENAQNESTKKENIQKENSEEMSSANK